MSIHVYINDKYYQLLSTNLLNITSVNEFKDFIKKTYNTEKEITITCYSSEVIVMNILKTPEKINYNYLVVSNSKVNSIKFYNLSSLVENYNNIPANMTIEIFRNVFSSNKIIINNINKDLVDSDYFDTNQMYYYKVIY